MSGKWLTRAGILVILMGLLLPSVKETGSDLTRTLKTYSLLDLANQEAISVRQPLLYLIPFSLFAILILTFFQPRYRSQAYDLLWGQLAAMAIAVFSLLVSILPILLNVLVGDSIEIIPAPWLVFLSGGFGFVLAGLVLHWLGVNAAALSETRFAPPSQTRKPTASRVPQPTLDAQVVRSTSLDQQNHLQPRLEIIHSVMGRSSFVPINTDDFTIGRAPGNSLQLLDISVSRKHARVRNAQGKWFVQDQGSKSGTYVNNQRVDAIRISSGDTISVGRNAFVFWSR